MFMYLKQLFELCVVDASLVFDGVAFPIARRCCGHDFFCNHGLLIGSLKKGFLALHHLILHFSYKVTNQRH